MCAFALIQGVDVTNQIANVVGGTSFDSITLHDSNARGTVTLTIGSTCFGDQVVG